MNCKIGIYSVVIDKNMQNGVICLQIGGGLGGGWLLVMWGLVDWLGGWLVDWLIG